MRAARRLRSLIFAALIAVGLGSSPVPAYAATLTVTSLDCEPRHGGFICEAHVSGGTGTYSYLWNSGAITNSYNFADGSRVVIGCPAGSTTRTITFKVTDSSGATASRSTQIDCRQTY
jgi:hypothetical protein